MHNTTRKDRGEYYFPNQEKWNFKSGKKKILYLGYISGYKTILQCG